MSDSHTRYVKIDDWYFELKTVRALRVDEYGKPYKAIATCNINGDQMYVDGLLSRDDAELSRENLIPFLKFAEQLGLEGFSYQRFYNGKSVSRDVKIDLLNLPKHTSKQSNEEDGVLRLVK